MTETSTLIDALQNPRIYSHEIEQFELIETHISWVLLTGHYVYKIKKPVNFGFLDFSTLQKRKFYCHEEIRKNARLAPSVYLDVVTVTGSETSPEINGQGSIIEYAVKMHQFNPDNTFDRLNRNNQLKIDHIHQLAEKIAEFHHLAPLPAEDSDFGTLGQVVQPMRDNFDQLAAVKLSHFDIPLNVIKQWTEANFITLKDILTSRKQEGFIKECHGDLHLGNVALIDNEVTPFDSIEFNPSLYWIDILSDIAFLVMDLEHRHRADLAHHFLNAYLQHSGDYNGLQVFNFYRVYRAIVMAKVSALRSTQCKGELNTTHLQNTGDYIQLAQDYIAQPRPVLIVMHGVSGSGKSWLAYKIIEHISAIIIRSDAERKRIKDQLNNDSPYSNHNTEKVYQHLLALAESILTSGYSVIVDATFLKNSHRELFKKLATNHHIPFKIVHTFSNQNVLKQRLLWRQHCSENISDADHEVMLKQFDALDHLTLNEKATSFSIDTSLTSSLDELIKFIDGK